MATISENLQIIADSTAAIKQAIIDKGGDVSGDITTWASAISGLSGGGSSSDEEITFTGYINSGSWGEFTLNGELNKLPDTVTDNYYFTAITYAYEWGTNIPVIDEYNATSLTISHTIDYGGILSIGTVDIMSIIIIWQDSDNNWKSKIVKFINNNMSTDLT